MRQPDTYLIPHVRVLLLCLLVLPGTVLAQSLEDQRPNPEIGPLISTLSYGIYCAEVPTDVTEAPDTAAGVVNLVPAPPRFEATSTVVPAELGIAFGVVLEAKAGDLLAPVEITITHPPYPDSGIEVERWETSIDSDGPNLIGFSFEHDHELVTGPWTFQAVYAGELLFFIAFEVVSPSLLPDLSMTCAGNFMS